MIRRAPRWTLIALALALLAGGIAGVSLIYQKLLEISEMDSLDSYAQAVEQTAANLNNRMASAEASMRALLYDTRLQASVLRERKEETLKNQLEEIKELRELVYFIEDSDDVTQVRLYLANEKMITRERINFFPVSEAEGLSEYGSVRSGRGSLVWIGMHNVETPYFSDTCVTLGCLYRISYSYSDGGWMLALIDISLNRFSESLSMLKLPDEEARVVVTDARGSGMAGTAGGREGALAAVLSRGASSGFCQDADKGVYAYVTRRLSAANWSISVFMPRGSLLKNRQSLRETLVVALIGLALLMVTLIAFVLYALYSRGVRNHIRAINEDLKSHGRRARGLTPANRALSDLDGNIGELLETNKRLAEANYRGQIREREVLLQALQAQINPHFLYNTLDSINWMAMRVGAADVSDMIATLADYFRLSLSRGRSVVTVREDAEIARKYLALYDHRYDYRYQVAWNLNDAALACAIPKLTLQPLVENALQHGIFQRREKDGGRILVEAETREGMLVIRVKDNGPGLGAAAVDHKGYGISNVRERLDLYFDGQYSMTIENAPEGGAVAVVTVAAAAPERE